MGIMGCGMRMEEAGRGIRWKSEWNGDKVWWCRYVY